MTPELYDLEMAFKAAAKLEFEIFLKKKNSFSLLLSFPFCHNFSLVALFPTLLIIICHYKTHLQLVCVCVRAHAFPVLVKNDADLPC